MNPRTTTKLSRAAKGNQNARKPKPAATPEYKCQRVEVTLVFMVQPEHDCSAQDSESLRQWMVGSIDNLPFDPQYGFPVCLEECAMVTRVNRIYGDGQEEE